MSKIWFLEDVNVFGALCPHKTKRYRERNHFCQYGKQDYIYFEEDAATKVYLIEKGKVKLGYYAEDGKEVVRAILTKGELFGEKAILGEESRSEFAQSLDAQTMVCPVPVGKMQELMRSKRTFSLKVYKFLGMRFKKLERRLDLLLFKDATTRVKEFLDELAEDFGYCCPNTGDTVIKHPYTQKDIASLIGTSRPTLNAIMNDLKAVNFLDFSRNEIRLKVA
ncbi:MAG: Crp/Fnr family transcriptional regulator [Dokdonia donghaensis]|nr:Crp/Fnr family transcriptional regulator [Dokdonia donghaensis]